MPKPPTYNIIYNWDGAPHGYSELPQSMDAFLEKVYAPMEDTQVGAHFWCIGEHAARWNSEVLELLGDVHGRRYENAQTFTFTENIRRMLERGEDPQEALIDRGHEMGLHVYASIRMNDNHFNGAQIGDLDKLHHTELTRIRIEHPEWVLGDQTSEWFALSWNFAVPEVREHRFAHIKEICEKYDWDGVELDWQRHAFHLPQHDAYRLRYVLTDLQRAVRNMTNDLAERRGRPFFLTTRVAGTLEMCRSIGYDLPTWIGEDLMDIVTPGGGAATDPSLDVAAFASLCGDKDIAVYPGFDGGLPDPFVGPEDLRTKDLKRTRAIANRYHKSGADGIYVFNWHADRNLRRELLSEIGMAETLRGKDKIYAATHRIIQREGNWHGAYRIDRTLGEVPVALKPTRTGEGPTITLDIADDVCAEGATGIELRLRLYQWVTGDTVKVYWDGNELQNRAIRYCMINDPHGVSDVTGAVWQSYLLTPDQVPSGSHTVKSILQTRNPQLACDMVLTDVELVIAY